MHAVPYYLSDKTDDSITKVDDRYFDESPLNDYEYFFRTKSDHWIHGKKRKRLEYVPRRPKRVRKDV